MLFLLTITLKINKYNLQLTLRTLQGKLSFSCSFCTLFGLQLCKLSYNVQKARYILLTLVISYWSLSALNQRVQPDGGVLVRFVQLSEENGGGPFCKLRNYQV